MRRLVALTLAMALASPAMVHAAERLYRVGVLTPSDNQWEPDAFREALRALGHADRLLIDVRSADAALDRLPALAEDLVRTAPDVILAVNTPGSRAVIDTGTRIPIVMAVVGDPVSLGFVDNLARPGKNVTGISNVAADLTAKRLALFKEAVPSLVRVAVLYHPDEPIARIQMQELESPARALGLEFRFAPVRSIEDLERAFDDAAAWGAHGVFRLAGQAITLAGQTSELALRHRMPLMALQGTDVRGGALISYFANQSELYRRAAVYVDRILKGTAPGALPIEQPTRFELFVNIRTARALGIVIPQVVLLRADEVIE